MRLSAQEFPWIDPAVCLAETEPPPLDPAVVRASHRMGMILARQMEGFVAWANSEDFVQGNLHAVPEDVLMQDDITDEFSRDFVAAYVDGALGAQRPGKRRLIRLKRSGVFAIDEHAARLAGAAVHAIRTRIMPILESVWSPAGVRVKPQQQVEDEIRSVYTSFIREGSIKPTDDVLELRTPDGRLVPFGLADVDAVMDQLVKKARHKGRPMKVRDRSQRDKFIKTRKPFTKWIKQSAAQIRAEALAPPQLSPQLAVRWLQTEVTRFESHGVFDATRNDPNVIGYQFVAKSGGVHPACQSANGMIRRKGDPVWAYLTPPLHHGCKSKLRPIYRKKNEKGRGKLKMTPKKELPDIDDIAEGFGMFNPKKVKAARELGIKPARRASR